MLIHSFSSNRTKNPKEDKMQRIFIAIIATASLLFNTQSIAQKQLIMQDLGSGVYHFYEGFFSSLVVVTNEGVLVTDPASTKRAKTLKQHLAKITDQEVKKIVLSHEHYDHVGGTEVFLGAEIICHESCAQFFDIDQNNFTPKKIDVAFSRKLKINMGGITIELSHLGPGDGVATTVIYLPQEEVVVTTDLYMPRSLSKGKWLDDTNFLGKRKILNELTRWNIRHAISGHSSSTDPKALKENAQYLNDLYDAVWVALEKSVKKKGLGGGFKVLQTLPDTLKLPKYRNWKGYEHLSTHTWRMGMSILHGG